MKKATGNNSAAKQEEPQSQEDPVASWSESAIDIIDDESLTAKARTKVMLRGIGAMHFPNEQRKAAALDQLRSFATTLPDLVSKAEWGIILHETAALHQRCEMLARPLAPTEITTPGIELEKHQHGLVAAGYSTLEFDGVLLALASGEKIVSYDARSITTDKQTLDRRKLRLSIMPRNYIHGEAAWLKNFPEILSAEDEAKQREQSEAGWRP